MTQSSVVPQRYLSVAVDPVMPDAELAVTSDVLEVWTGCERSVVPLMRCFPVQCAVWTFSVVNLLEFIQDPLQLGDRFGSWACVDPEVLRVVETLDFALGLRVIWFPVLLVYPQCDQ